MWKFSCVLNQLYKFIASGLGIPYDKDSNRKFISRNEELRMEEVPDAQPPATAHSIKDLQQQLQVPSLDHGLSKAEAAERLKVKMADFSATV